MGGWQRPARRSGTGSTHYDDDHPDHLAVVSGPNGVSSYTYETDRGGSPRLVQMKQGDQTRRFEWDDFGRLTKDEGGNEDRSFEYRVDGITEGGSSSRKVTWDEAGLPATVESDGKTEIWTWNQDRTLRIHHPERQGTPTALRRPGVDGWLRRRTSGSVGFDKNDSDDDVAMAWAPPSE